MSEAATTLLFKMCPRCLVVRPLERFRPGRGTCLDCHARHEREKARQKREGTYVFPKRSADPTREPTVADIAWTAGFLEGEGCFQRRNTSLAVEAVQATREPLETLLELWGGTINLRRPATDRWKEIHQWSVYGDRARKVCAAIEPYLSARRREQIRESHEGR